MEDRNLLNKKDMKWFCYPKSASESLSLPLTIDQEIPGLGWDWDYRDGGVDGQGLAKALIPVIHLSLHPELYNRSRFKNLPEFPRSGRTIVISWICLKWMQNKLLIRVEKNFVTNMMIYIRVLHKNGIKDVTFIWKHERIRNQRRGSIIDGCIIAGRRGHMGERVKGSNWEGGELS